LFVTGYHPGVKKPSKKAKARGLLWRWMVMISQSTVKFLKGILMPLGMQLTEHWLQHLLPDDEYDLLYRKYNKVMDAIGRQGPRLEKVIDDAITIFGEKCLAPLGFFGDCPSNAMHRLVKWYHKAEPHLYDQSNGAGDLYRETDSILGVINHSRSKAFEDLNGWLSLGKKDRAARF
jgi:hypothetical protein